MAAERSGRSALHVLVVGVRWPAETFIVRLLDGLLSAGIEVTAASAQRPGLEWLKRPGFHWLPSPTTLKKALPIFAPYLAALTGAFVRSPKRFAGELRAASGGAWFQRLPFVGRRWDVIYFPWNNAAIHYPNLFETGAPVVISCRGAQVNIAPHNPQRQAMRDGLRASFQKAALVHCVSEAIQAEAVELGLDPAKARVIRPAVDAGFFHPGDASPPHGRFTLVTTGSLIWRKGYEFALMAFRGLLDAGVDAEFHIIGDGPERQRILFTAQDLGLHERVLLHGKLQPADVRARLQQADVFVLSSLSEGISNAALEAMSCGLPVVTTDCGGMREAVTDGVEGFVVPVRDPWAMAEALKTLSAQPVLRRQMGTAARERIVREFNTPDQLAGFIHLFEGSGEK